MFIKSFVRNILTDLDSLVEYLFKLSYSILWLGGVRKFLIYKKDAFFNKTVDVLVNIKPHSNIESVLFSFVAIGLFAFAYHLNKLP